MGASSSSSARAVERWFPSDENSVGNNIQKKDIQQIVEYCPSDISQKLEILLKEHKTEDVPRTDLKNLLKFNEDVKVKKTICEAIRNAAAVEDQRRQNEDEESRFRLRSKREGNLLELNVKIHQAKGLPSADTDGTIDPYVVAWIGPDLERGDPSMTGTRIRNRARMNNWNKKQTVPVIESHNPYWKASFWFELDVYVNHYIFFELWDKDNYTNNDLIAQLVVPLTHETCSNSGPKWYPFCRVKGTQAAGSGLRFGYVQLEFICQNAKVFQDRDRQFRLLYDKFIKTHGKSFYTVPSPLEGNSSAEESKKFKAEEKSRKMYTLPTEKEKLEVVFDDITMSMSGRPITKGSLMCSEYRMLFLPPLVRNEDSMAPQGADPALYRFTNSEWVCQPMDIPLHLIMSSSLSVGGRGTGKAVEQVDQKGPNQLQWFVLAIEVEDFRIIEFLIITETEDARAKLSEFTRRLRVPIESRPSSLPLSMSLKLGIPADQEEKPIYDARKEMERQGLDFKYWRETKLNEDYKLCESYPRKLFVPKASTDDILKNSAAFRSKLRLPVLTWFDPTSGVGISRCAQPRVGLNNSNSPHDEIHINNIRLASQKIMPDPELLKAAETGNISMLRPRRSISEGETTKDRLVIIDCRSRLAADANSFAGKGTENIARYRKCKLSFQDIANIHSVRQSLTLLRSAVTSTLEDSSWLLNLHQSQWLFHISSILSATLRAVYYIKHRKVPVVVHCSDGWDRTSQVCALSQIIMDPFYRTIDGLIILIEKDWFSFGHKFKERLGFEMAHLHEASPVFHQFLDCIWQIMQQFPTSFEYNEKMLKDLTIMSKTLWFREFHANTEKARRVQKGLSIWGYIYANRENYKNKLFNPKLDHKKTLLITPTMKQMKLWPSLYLAFDECHMGNLRFRKYRGRGGILTRISRSPNRSISTNPLGNMPRITSESEMSPKLTISPKTVERKLSRPLSIRSSKKGSIIMQDTVVMWEPDEWSATCHDCNEYFTWVRRRHHCRSCGRLFCHKCSQNRIPLPHLGIVEKVRVCERCADAIAHRTKHQSVFSLIDRGEDSVCVKH
mmetsp:Transcript_2955/g.4347  ORF Transcript_2955/g.4347 Transcript_2955/m.4347 type:complete len:1068 (+) Transcript_2955:24-3227(+)